ncbi:MBL fold metallo-hydrolase [Corynebacterium renale]|uniref:Ribonuclease BN (tRNA processing enzyme) n=1 Tax=Corynebacterium renale TaxID=1724 RepID=A0A2A9DPL0_9CORY|nr:MBL fold metallo-hydrolase [Corynebacterium renale]PFG28115.1 ribonuclease BN (tRNA processing enzyme) [Corynebacterium renale]
MKVTILGSSGSLAAPGNAASGYFIQPDADTPGVIMDLGPGTLAELQNIGDPSQAHVLFSHLHADHCLDFPSLLVWRRYHPDAAAKGRNLLHGPSTTPVHLGRISSDEQPDGVDDFSDTFAFAAWEHGRQEIVEKLLVTPYEAVHPVEAYAIRVEEPSTGASLAYTGDSAWTDNLVDAARGVDLLLAEATWGNTCEGKVRGMHLCGHEAGALARKAGAKRLVVVHVPPWIDPQEAVDAAAEEFDGPIEFGHPRSEYVL